MRKAMLIVMIALLLAAVVVPMAMAADQPLTSGNPAPDAPDYNQDFYQQMFQLCHGNGGMMGGGGGAGMMGGNWGNNGQNRNQGFQGMGYYAPRNMMYY